ncbi:MAG TPA: pyridoxamine 5'-phosphate oxidase [Microthrixaceae bacterium]|nr:pyridoxamine 5'-phosphate oxidase [Microthrixaceae bacterium]
MSEYSRGRLDEADLAEDPVDQILGWVGDAAAAGLPEPTAMTLSTVDPDGAPASRVVLMRGVIDGELVLFTNLDSAKSRDLRAEPRCALQFGWLPLERQIRITGTASPLDDVAADEYFESRPRESQLGAWASPQSEVIPDRTWLEARVIQVTAQFEGEAVTRPPNWGGFRVRPSTVEFWQGRPARLHDRLRYRRVDDGWVIERLAP